MSIIDNHGLRLRKLFIENYYQKNKYFISKNNLSSKSSKICILKIDFKLGKLRFLIFSYFDKINEIYWIFAIYLLYTMPEILSKSPGCFSTK